MDKTFLAATGAAILILFLVVGGVFYKRYESNKPKLPANYQTPQEIKEDANIISSIPALISFTEPQFPDTQFKIKNIYRVQNGVPVSLCGRLSGGWQESNSANCPLPGFIVDGEPGNLVLLEFTINNLSSIRVVGDFFKISWIDSTGEIKYAQKYINWASNGAEPLSTQEWVVGFKVPSNINSFFINAGNYSAEFNNGDFSHKYIFKVDFDSKKIQDLSGS